MRVKLSKAVKMLLGNSSLEMVYFEAIVNTLDTDTRNSFFMNVIKSKFKN